MVACNIFRTNTNAVQEKKEIDLCIDSTILGLSSVLLQKVGDFISHTDSDGYKKWPVINVLFYPAAREVKCNNCIWITNSLTYQEQFITGYCRYKSKIIGINKHRGPYFDNFIDTTRLQKIAPEDIPREFNGASEPWLRIYEIINNDSLHLIYDGYL